MILAIGLIFFTFIAMVGGNPLHEYVLPEPAGPLIFTETDRSPKLSRFGFRYWKSPGPWAGEDSSGRLISFLNAVNVAGFCMAGPEYISSESTLITRKWMLFPFRSLTNA